jgi:D,D-heptose 1,7-bisphosphate phosphatase
VKPAVFLDRDGTVIEHVHHLTQPEQVRLLPGAADAIRQLQSLGFACVIVTNQSVIGRGMLSVEGLKRVHDEMDRQLAAQAVRLDGLYYCPAAPAGVAGATADHPERKPAPGMLLRAARELSLDLCRSWMIGDAESDLLAGRNAGCLACVLVRTGQGAGVKADEIGADYVADDLPGAVRHIAEGLKPPSHPKELTR